MCAAEMMLHCCLCVEMCGTCYAEQLEAEYLAQMSYENGTIYVSKVAEVDRTIAHGSGSGASSNQDDCINVSDDQVFYTANTLLSVLAMYIKYCLPSSVYTIMWSFLWAALNLHHVHLMPWYSI